MKIRLTYKKGLTLIEVMIAMVILSLGVSSLMIAMSKSLGVVRTARHRNNARNLLRQVDIENPINEKEIEESQESGRFEGYDDYVWEREIEQVDEEEKPGLFIVTTRIIWSERGQNSYEEIISYKYAPDAESVKSEI